MGLPCLLLLGASEKTAGRPPSRWSLGTNVSFAVPPLAKIVSDKVGSILLDLRKWIRNQTHHFLGQTHPMFGCYKWL